MPNQLAFDVKITRDQLDAILSNEKVQYIVVSGTSTYTGNGKWDVVTSAIGYDSQQNAIGNDGPQNATATTPPPPPCIQPCP